MAGRRIRVSRRMLITWFMLAGSIFLFAPQSLTNKFQFTFARVFHWPLSMGRNISLSTRSRQSPGDVVSRREYNKLQNHLSNVIEQRNQAYAKVEKLSGLQNKGPLRDARFILADVIKVAGTELTINCGRDCRLAKGQFVIGDNSVIGIVSDVWSHTAKVKLVTDSEFRVPVKIEDLNIDVVAQGDGADSIRIRLVPAKYKVKIGADVYVRKMPGMLKSPLIVGEISQCKRDGENPLLWDITVKPVCDMEKLSDVAVLIVNRPE